jgi:hypothetical protein
MRQPFDVVQEGARDRRGLVRMVLLHAPFVVGSAVGALWLLLLLLGGEGGAIIGLVLAGLVLFATVFQAVTGLRDLRAEPVTTIGIVLRKRRPGIFLTLGRTHYLRLREGAFVVSVPAYHELQEGDEVEIDHWPHTRRVIRVRLLRRVADIEAAERALAASPAVDGGAVGGTAGEDRAEGEGWRPPHLR